MTMGERVGSVFSIALALHNHEIAKIFMEGHERQRVKYSALPPLTDGESNYPMYYEKYMHTLQPDQCFHTLTHLLRHGFDIRQLESMDPFQINQLIYHTSEIFENTSYPDAYPQFQTIGTMYTDLGSKPRIEKRLLNAVVAALNPKKDHIFQRHRMVSVASVTSKHHCKKPKQKGEGSTCAYLGTKTSSLIHFLEYTLCYHAFCKYSSTLPANIRQDVELIDHSGRSLLAYFCRMIYRGDATIDSRTTKIHAQRRLGYNFNSLGTVMHACCEVGERLLKTEAKKVSRTAQQRGCTTFERQTCSRILDRHLFDKMRLSLERKNNLNQLADETHSEVKSDHFSRQQPHFILFRADRTVLACDRKGKHFVPNENTGRPSQFVCEKLLELEAEIDTIELYNEVILRDGSYVRASPNHRGEGPWFDFSNVQWEDEMGGTYYLPGLCLAFYKKNQTCMALLQSVDMKSEGKVPRYQNSILTTHYKMQVTRSGAPVVYSINCASIDSSLLWFDHEINHPNDTFIRRSVMIVRPRNEWAYAWYVWNQYLRVKNTNRSITKPMVDLGREEDIVKVRKNISECIRQHGGTVDVPK